MGSSSSKLPPLQVAASVDTAKFMGTWFVVGVKPTLLEKTCSNAVERYTWITQNTTTNSDNTKTSSHDIDIDFSYNSKETTDSPVKKAPQKGWIQGTDKSHSSEWKVSPLWPIKLPYLILETDPLCQEYCVIGFPNRDYCWIMGRTPRMNAATYDKLTALLQDKHQYSLDGLRRVPQQWTREERDKRGLTAKEIPDDMLLN